MPNRRKLILFVIHVFDLSSNFLLVCFVRSMCSCYLQGGSNEINSFVNNPLWILNLSRILMNLKV